MDDVTIRPAEGVVSCELSDGAALLDTRSNIYYGLNQAGFRLWNAIQPSATKSALVDLMTEHYRLDRSTALVDLDRLLTDLKTAGLIELSGPREG